jgi:hypothetical protein
MRAVRQHLGRRQPLNELSEPAATNLLGAHVEFTSPDEAYTDLTNALLASRVKVSADGYQFEQRRSGPIAETCSSTPRSSDVKSGHRWPTPPRGHRERDDQRPRWRSTRGCPNVLESHENPTKPVQTLRSIVPGNYGLGFNFSVEVNQPYWGKLRETSKTIEIGLIIRR